MCYWYQGTHEDYLELFIQFGYVLLFMVTYPMASFWALINNVLELRTDAFKLSRIFRRPPVARVGHIGAWQVIVFFSPNNFIYIFFLAKQLTLDYYGKKIIACIWLSLLFSL